MPRAGKYRHRVEVQSLTEVTDSWGEVDENFATFKTIWAHVRQMSGRELEQFDRVMPETSLVISYRGQAADVTSDMRMVYRGEVYNIAWVDKFEGLDIEHRAYVTSEDPG